MRIKPFGSRRGGALICILLVIAVVVIGIIIYMIIKFCREHLGTKPPPNQTNDAPALVIEAARELPATVPPAVRARVDLPHTGKPECPGFSGALLAPQNLPAGVRIFVQRSTNLVTWEDREELFPDENNICQWCDPEPPWPAAFYRLRAQVSQ